MLKHWWRHQRLKWGYRRLWWFLTFAQWKLQVRRWRFLWAAHKLRRMQRSLERTL